jgi:hypothetical protein
LVVFSLHLRLKQSRLRQDILDETKLRFEMSEMSTEKRAALDSEHCDDVLGSVDADEPLRKFSRLAADVNVEKKASRSPSVEESRSVATL